ncbi:aminoacylase-1B-like [Haliotis rufescens]|uniref:aminoacylase-1B-like n=1 Tax=Haliotis rufescens TaxID=6454 RepID=UPI00201F0FB5|nr:aminoacylase-1B-like [Haliotis rufescens]XP_046354329.2 aminoacylase-1B-like [Haliotis rufescens]
MENPAVTIFRNYLKIKSVQPEPDYSETTAFLSDLAKDIGLECKVVEALPGKPFVVMTWRGTDPGQKSLMLHSHVDVVPVFPEQWKVDPFSAEKTDNGDIIARGSQDMKCISIQYLEAIRRLKADGKQCLRDIHLTFSSDEEIGSKPMAAFVKHEAFKKLNVAYALDEGIANPGKEFRVFYGERSMWWVQVTCKGRPGHGSGFIENTAASKVRKVMNSFLQFRDDEENRLKSDPNLSHGDVTTVNMTILKGGIQFNVVPAELGLSFDIRMPPSVDVIKFENQIKAWCQEAGEDVTYDFVIKDTNTKTAPISKQDPWWNAFSSTLERLGVEYKTEIFPAGTDSRFTRECGIPALGFSPMNHTPILLHDHNEFLNEKVFLRGIDIYYEIIPALANVTA